MAINASRGWDKYKVCIKTNTHQQFKAINLNATVLQLRYDPYGSFIYWTWQFMAWD